MLQHRSTEKALSLNLFAVGLGIAERLIAFKRKFGVNHNHSRRIGQIQHAVGAFLITEHNLKSISRGRQSRSDEVIQLNLAESAARLLVGKDFLQRDDLLRQTGNLLLGNIYLGQTFTQVVQRFRRFGG